MNDEIARLVDMFAANEPRYTHPTYNETDTRVEFIDPFFRALGWDVNNIKGVAPDLRDVLREQPFRRNLTSKQDLYEQAGMVGKRPDYTFRLKQRPRYYVEAKKPAENIHKNSKYAAQIRSYGWNTRLPISILTDFQELEAVMNIHSQEG